MAKLVMVLLLWGASWCGVCPLPPAQGSTGVLIGELPQAYILYTQLCKGDKEGPGKACSIYKAAVKGGWAYIVYQWGDEDSGSGVARLVQGKWKVLTKGGGALAEEGLVEKGAPKKLAQELVGMVTRCEGPDGY